MYIRACCLRIIPPPRAEAQSSLLENERPHGAETSRKSSRSPYLIHLLSSAVRVSLANSESYEIVTCHSLETLNLGMVCYATVDKEYPFEIGASLSVAPQK